MIMSKAVRRLALISRAEFILPNLGSLIMGFAWGVNPQIDLAELVILVGLSFTIINLSSAIGAQANTISDYELDSRDSRKKELVQTLDSFGHNRLKKVLIAEFMVTFALVVVFMLIKTNPVLLLVWLIGISLGCLYSAGIAFMFVLPQMFLGTFVSLAMSGIAQFIGRFVPSYYVTDALTSLLLRGAPITSPTILIDLLVVSTTSLLVLLAGIILFRKFGRA